MRWFKRLLFLGVLLSLTLVVFLAISIKNIDKLWSPLLEVKLLEQQKKNSVRILAHNEKGDAKWLGSLTQGKMEERNFIKLKDVPPLLVQSIISVEDQRFLEHSGFDSIGILRAAVRSAMQMRFAQGGSTLTQQLVKNMFLTPERTIKRKFTEIILSILIERRFSKDTILEAYFNEVYLGQLGNVEIHGVSRAANYYFAKEVDELDLSESALLAAIINSPGRFNPWRHPERAKARRKKVLLALVRNNFILPQEAAVADMNPLPKKSKMLTDSQSQFLLNIVKKKLIETYGEYEVIKGGFDVITSIDLDLQRLSEKHLKAVPKKFGKEYQALIVAADPQNCNILAYAGGTNYHYTQLDRIVSSKRSIGSLIKPLILSSVLDEGSHIELATPLLDEEFTWHYDRGNGQWSPKNFDKKFRGEVTVRTAVEQSLNVPFIRLVHDLEPNGTLYDFFDPQRALGLKIPKHLALPSSALGTNEQKPWDVLQAFVKVTRQAMGLAENAGDFGCKLGFFKNQNSSPESVATSEEEDQAYKGVEIEVDHYRQVGARLTLSVLEGALRRGTSRYLGAQLPLTQQWGGKTGTGSDQKDSWYVAVSPNLVILSWMGRDDNKENELTGSSGALRLLSPIIKYWSSNKQNKNWEWPMPKGIHWSVVKNDSNCLLSKNQTRALKITLNDKMKTTPPPTSFRHLGQNYRLELIKNSRNISTCDIVEE